MQKYLIRPKQVRDNNGDRRETVTIVSNRYGTTGMDPLGIIKHLDTARANHCLASFTTRRELQPTIKRLAEQFGYQALSYEALLQIAQVGE